MSAAQRTKTTTATQFVMTKKHAPLVITVNHQWLPIRKVDRPAAIRSRVWAQEKATRNRSHLRAAAPGREGGSAITILCRDQFIADFCGFSDA
jgi:hypothetical protein